MTKQDKELKQARDIQHALDAVKKTETRVLRPYGEHESSFIESVREYKLAVQYLNELTK